MNAHLTEEQLNDRIDGLLEPADAAAVDAHLAVCAECADQATSLRRLLAMTAELPRSIEPPADTWAGIADRTIDLGRHRREVLRDLRAPLAAAAIVFVALGAGTTALLLRSDTAAPTATAAAPAVPAIDGAGEAQAAFVAAESEYERTYNGLIEEYRAVLPQLDTATVRVVEENLLIIDQALARARAALQADPSNRDLPLLITATHRKRIDLVERALRLSTRTDRSQA